MSDDFNAILNWLGAAVGFIVGAIALFSVSLILLAYPEIAWMAVAFEWSSLALVVIFGISVQIARRCTYLYYQRKIGEKPNKESRSWNAWENLETTYHALTATVLLSVAALVTQILKGSIAALVGSVATNFVMIITAMVFLIVFKKSLDG